MYSVRKGGRFAAHSWTEFVGLLNEKLDATFKTEDQDAATYPVIHIDFRGRDGGIYPDQEDGILHVIVSPDPLRMPPPSHIVTLIWDPGNVFKKIDNLDNLAKALGISLKN